MSDPTTLDAGNVLAFAREMRRAGVGLLTFHPDGKIADIRIWPVVPEEPATDTIAPEHPIAQSLQQQHDAEIEAKRKELDRRAADDRVLFAASEGYEPDAEQQLMEKSLERHYR